MEIYNIYICKSISYIVLPLIAAIVIIKKHLIPCFLLGNHPQSSFFG